MCKSVGTAKLNLILNIPIHLAHGSRICLMQSSEVLEKLQARIEKIEKQIDDSKDPAQKTALLLNVLAPLLQRENFLLGEQA